MRPAGAAYQLTCGKDRPPIKWVKELVWLSLPPSRGGGRQAALGEEPLLPPKLMPWQYLIHHTFPKECVLNHESLAADSVRGKLHYRK